MITTAASIFLTSLLFVLCFNKSVVWRWLKGAHWSGGCIKTHTERETRPSSFVTALLWLTRCYIYILPAGDQMYDVLKVWCVIVPCSYQCFYALHRAIVRYKKKRAVVTIQITDISLQTPWRFALVWVFSAELCREIIDRLKPLGLICWNLLKVYFLGQHNRQESFN